MRYAGRRPVPADDGVAQPDADGPPAVIALLLRSLFADRVGHTGGIARHRSGDHRIRPRHGTGRGREAASVGIAAGDEIDHGGSLYIAGHKLGPTALGTLIGAGARGQQVLTGIRLDDTALIL